MADTDASDVADTTRLKRLPRAAGGVSPLGEAAAELLNALSAACALYPVDRCQGMIEWLLSVEAFLAKLARFQAADSFKAVNLAFPARLLIEDLKRLPVRDAERLLHHQWSRRIERAVAAASVERLRRLGWKQRLAADHVGRKIGTPWQTVLGWRNALEEVPLADNAGEEDDPRPDVTAYHAALQDPDADQAAALARVDAHLGIFFPLSGGLGEPPTRRTLRLDRNKLSTNPTGLQTNSL